MVLKKRLDYGFNGFHIPSVPKAPRSARRRGPHKKAIDNNEICAFELLASLAGKLLQESESSSASSNASEGKNNFAYGKDVIKQDRKYKDKSLKEECFELGRSEESAYVSETTSRDIDQKFTIKGSPHCAKSDSFLGYNTDHAKLDCLNKVDCDLKSVGCKSKPEFQAYISTVGNSPFIGESCHANVSDGLHGQGRVNKLETEALTTANTCSSKDPMELCPNLDAMLNSDENVEFPSLRDSVSNASFSRHKNDINLGSRDDDGKLIRCSKPNTKVKAFRREARVGDRRIRKLFTSKNWKVAPKLRDCEVFRSDGGIKPLYHKRKTCNKRDRSQQETPFKKRKLFNWSSIVTSDGGLSSESVSNSPEKGMNSDKNDLVGMSHEAIAMSSSILGHQSSSHSKDSHVKLSIKSFHVPELYIEMPDTATVASLKRAVKEAVGAILGGGLHVGIHLQGKKIKDDSKTLLQTGVSCKDNMDALGFTLEPSAVQAYPTIYSSDTCLSLPCDSTPEPLIRSPGAPPLDSEISDSLLEHPIITISDIHDENNLGSVSSTTDTLTEKTTLDSQALVPVSEMSMEALAVIPLNQKGRKSELVQRRTRRPFTVIEVEALVKAVEELGTGRWRDVKLCAFEVADHRTYVDLKDKWKTLVHTAKISPQQRRGEPVPQELLNRVLAAHAYWSQHQAKQNGKHQNGTLKIAETLADKQGSEVTPVI